MGYHIREIKKGVLGTSSKIREELDELEDALEQGVKIMVLVEMADLYGALEAMAETLGITIGDLKDMSNITKRAFSDGSRKSKDPI